MSDFGTNDEFAGVVRAVVIRDAPGAQVVDLTHEIPHFEVRAGALALERAVPHLGPGVVVAVVDPGVGTERRAVAVTCAIDEGPRFFVGPDNGLLGFALDALGGARAAVVLHRPPRSPDVGATFDGRDLFAPAAARLLCGEDLDALGSRIDPAELVHLEVPRVRVVDRTVETEVLWIDAFGNVQLAARPVDLVEARMGTRVEVVTPGSTTEVATSTSFSVGGRVGLITDSNGRLALVCERRSAATVLSVNTGDVLLLRESN